MKTSGQKSLSKNVSVYTLGCILQKNIRGIKTTRMAHTIRILFLCRSVGWKWKRKLSLQQVQIQALEIHGYQNHCSV